MPALPQGEPAVAPRQGVSPSAQGGRSTTVVLLVLLHPLRERSDCHPLNEVTPPEAKPTPPHLVHHPSAVDLNQLASDERRPVPGQKRHQIPDVLRGSPSLNALGGEDLSIVVLEVGMNLLGIGREGPR